MSHNHREIKYGFHDFFRSVFMSGISHTEDAGNRHGVNLSFKRTHTPTNSLFVEGQRFLAGYADDTGNLHRQTGRQIIILLKTDEQQTDAATFVFHDGVRRQSCGERNISDVFQRFGIQFRKHAADPANEIIVSRQRFRRGKNFFAFPFQNNAVGISAAGIYTQYYGHFFLP